MLNLLKLTDKKKLISAQHITVISHLKTETFKKNYGTENWDDLQ